MKNPLMTDPHAIAYILKGFPRLSETFIANEIHLLEEFGMRLRVYSVKDGDRGARHAVVDRIRAPIEYLPRVTSISGRSLIGWLRENAGPYVGGHLRVAARHPIRYARALGQAICMARRYRAEDGAARKVFVKEFVQAGAIAADLIARRDCAHLHGHFCHGATTITWLVATLTGLPFTFTAHAKDIYQAKLNPGDLLARKIGAARFVVTCTCANETHLRANADVPANAAIHTIYHGLDTRIFRPVDTKTESTRTLLAKAGLDTVNPTAAPTILTVGRFVEKKGYATLVDACALLAARGIAFHCAIVGERGDDYEPIAARINAAGLSRQVTLHDPVTQESLLDYYRAAMLFVLPCQVLEDGDRDGIPNVLVEAMAMGLSVVSTAVSGIPELVDDGEDGLLVPPRSPQALADAIARVLESAPLREALARAGRAKVLAQFDSQRTTRRLASLFCATMGINLAPAARSQDIGGERPLEAM